MLEIMLFGTAYAMNPFKQSFWRWFKLNQHHSHVRKLDFANLIACWGMFSREGSSLHV